MRTQITSIIVDKVLHLFKSQATPNHLWKTSRTESHINCIFLQNDKET